MTVPAMKITGPQSNDFASTLAAGGKAKKTTKNIS